MSEPLDGASPYRTGDLVGCASDERRIVVGYVDGDMLHGVFGRAVPLVACRLLQPVSDDDHRALLLELSDYDTRLGSHARGELERLVGAMTP